MVEVSKSLEWSSKSLVKASKFLPSVSKFLIYLSKRVAGFSTFRKQATAVQIKNPVLHLCTGFFIGNYVVAGGSSSLPFEVPIFLTTLLKVNCSFFSGSSWYILDAILQIPITSS